MDDLLGQLKTAEEERDKWREKFESVSIVDGPPPDLVEFSFEG